jgi:hypothetical protein
VSGDVHTPTNAGPADKSPTFGGAPTPEPPAPALERPEVQAGAAFAGGLVVAMILKRLGH